MSNANKAFFDENGYLIVQGLIPRDVLQQLTRELEEMQASIESRNYRGNHLFENDKVARVLFNPYDLCPTLRNIIDAPDIIGLVQEILGTSLRLDHTKLMCKAARTGTVVLPHQDFYYWAEKKPNQVAIFMPIDACTAANGCLRLYPGSHREGLLPHAKQFHEVTGERHWVCEIPEKYRAHEVAFEAQPGDVCFFNSLVIHRSDPNTSDHNRRCLVIEFDELGNLTERPGWGSPIPPKTWESLAYTAKGAAS